MPTGDAGRTAKSAERAVLVLERLAAANRALGPADRTLSLADLARDLDLPKSSLHLVVGALLQRGWVERDEAGALRIGLRALQVGAAYVDADPVVAAADPVLDELAAALDETVHLARLDGGDVVYVAKRESSHQLRLFSAVGRRLPAHATALGKALLAELSDDEVAALLPRELPALTAATITDRSVLLAELSAVRARGWAVDDGESTHGIVCLAFAVPVESPPRDALSCSIPTVRLDAEQRQLALRLLREARDRLAAAVPRRSVTLDR